MIRRAAAPAPPGVRVDALVEHVGAVADPQRLVGVLLHDQHRHAGGVDVADALEDLVLHLRRQARGGLVEQHQRRLHHQRAAHGEDLPLAARERVGPGVAPLPQDREQVEHLVAPVNRSPKKILCGRFSRL